MHRTLVVVSLLILIAARVSAHPLDPLSAEEHREAFEITRAHLAAASDAPEDGLLFPFIALREPAKALVLGGAVNLPREATVHALDSEANRLWIATVDLTAGVVRRLELAPAGTQPAVAAEEYAIAEELVRTFEPWIAAMQVRGVDPEEVYVDVWAPGDLALPAGIVATLPHGSQTRLLRALAFLRGPASGAEDPENPQNPYVRPIEGVVVTVDMNERRVVHMTDTVVRPVSRDSGNAAVRRTGLEPMRVVQPAGAGFEVSGRLVRWQNWQFFVVLHPREGLVLHDVRYQDRNRLRPVAYRMSLSEIYVPYGLADPNWVWRSAFDVGEYNLGSYAQTLEPDRDVPEYAYFFDAVFGSDTGPAEDNPTGTYDYPDSIAMFERDAGLLWTRTDPSSAERDTRGRRDLVLTWNAWIGNYIYGFDWIFGMDGTIDVKVVLTGTLLTRGAGEEEEESAPLVAVDDLGARVSAPNHQHFFSFRLDLDVDGTANTVSESDVRHVPTPGFENAFAAEETLLTMEGFRDADPYRARHWEIASATEENALGSHTAWAVETSAFAVPYSSPDYEPLHRAAYASHAFWVTRYRDYELYAAGDFPNQGPAGAGLVSFVTPPEPLDLEAGTDIVVWQTIGKTHVPRPEDHPVMPTETIGFQIVPHGFFDRNPSLDAQELPRQPTRRRGIRRP